MFDMHSFLILLTVSLVTIAIRFSPFIIFRNKVPKVVEYLSKVLPFSVIGMLVVYCYKDTSFADIRSFVPQIVAGLITVVTHKWKHNTLLSILVGTVCYIAIIRFL